MRLGYDLVNRSDCERDMKSPVEQLTEMAAEFEGTLVDESKPPENTWIVEATVWQPEDLKAVIHSRYYFIEESAAHKFKQKLFGIYNAPGCLSGWNLAEIMLSKAEDLSDRGSGSGSDGSAAPAYLDVRERITKT